MENVTGEEEEMEEWYVTGFIMQGRATNRNQDKANARIHTKVRSKLR